jgi:hypothetical protein
VIKSKHLHQLDKSDWVLPNMVILKFAQSKAIKQCYKDTDTLDRMSCGWSKSCHQALGLYFNDNVEDCSLSKDQEPQRQSLPVSINRT